MSLKIDVSWTLVIKVGSIMWEPSKVTQIEGEYYVNICASDLSLCKAVAAASNVSAKLTSKARPTLRNTQGACALFKLRNAQQSVDMAAGVDGEAVRPTKRLFGGQASSANKARRSAGQVASMRERSDVFAVSIPAIADRDASVAWMKRPINVNDALYVKADADSMLGALGYIVACGLTPLCFTTRREYATSGEEKVWKFGSAYYRKSVDGKYCKLRADEGGHADGQRDNREATEHDEDDGDDGDVGFSLDGLDDADADGCDG